MAMSKKSKQLVREMSELMECTDRLRTVLLHFKKSIATVSSLMEERDITLAELKATRGPGWRQELNEALEDFEALRHQVRVTFLTLAQEQGTSISEAGRMLGISRQLASRVAAEADD